MIILLIGFSAILEKSMLWCAPVIYDFSFGSGTIRWAYESVSGDFTDPTGGTEFTGVKYSSAAFSDNVRAATAGSGKAAIVAQRFLFKINDSTSIARMCISWEGYTAAPATTGKTPLFYVWNFNTTSWLLIQTGTAQTSDQTLWTEFTSNIDYYVQQSSCHIKVTCPAQAGQESNVFTDYVKVDTYGYPDLTLNSSDISFSNTLPAPGDVITISATVRNNGESVLSPIGSIFDNFETGGSVSAGVYLNQWIGQKFDVPRDLCLSKASLYIADLGASASDDITVDIRKDNNSAPGTGSDNLLASKTLDSSLTSLGWQDFTFDSPPLLTAGNIYWITLANNNATSANAYSYYLQNPATLDEIAISANQGASWTGMPSYDYCGYFRVYDSTTVTVQIYDGDPDSGGSLIAVKSAFPIAGGSTSLISTTWTYTAGSHNIYIKIDPAGSITETNESNNKVYNTVSAETTAPNAITNLSALTGVDGTEIKLSWVAPGDDGISGDNTSRAKYILHYATFSCESAGSTAAWWFGVNVSTYTQYWAVSPQGTKEDKIIGGGMFTPGSTYYFAIKTVDKCLNVSNIDDNAWTQATQAKTYAQNGVQDLIPPAAISNLTAITGSAEGTIQLTWTATGDDGNVGTAFGYLVKYATFQITTSNFYNPNVSTYTDASSWMPISSGGSESKVISGLTGGVTYYFAIKAFDNDYAPNYTSWDTGTPSDGVNDKNSARPKRNQIYYVNSLAPDDSGVPGSDPAILDNCWKTIGKAFSDLQANVSNDLTGFGSFVIQIQNSADYIEGVMLNNLTTTPNDGLTIRSAKDTRPEWKNNTSNILFCNYDSKNSYGALYISIPFVTIEGINFTGTKEHGIFINASTITVRNCIFHDLGVSRGNYNHSSIAIYQTTTGCEFYDNTFYNVICCFRFVSGPFKVRNNTFCINDISTEVEVVFLCYDGPGNGIPDSNYNIFQIATGGAIARAPWTVPTDYVTLVDWKGAAITPAPDANSLSADPQFVAAGTDFHLKSTFGHWTAAGWVKDATTSPCIDAGTPYSTGVKYTYYDNEPQPNGSRVNMGAYANTNQASVSGNMTPDIPAALSQLDPNWQQIPFGNWINYQQARATFTLLDPAGDLVQFNIQFSTYTDFSYNFINSTNPATATLSNGATNFLTPLLSEGTWYWRVRCIDVGGAVSDYSSATVVNGRHFGVDVSSPSVPVLSSPLDNFTTSQLLINFNWSASVDNLSGVYGYGIRVSTSDSFAGTVYSSFTANTFASFMLPEGQWYWTVRSSDTAGCYSNWASTFSVIVDTSPPSAITTLSALQTNYVDEIKLTWSAMGDDGTIGNITSGKYRIQYSSETSVNWNVNNYIVEYPTDTIVNEVQTKVITGLEYSATYYFCIWTADKTNNWSTYIDTVSCLTPELILSIEILTTYYHFGSLEKSSVVVSGTSLIVKNAGNVYETYSLLGSSSTRWDIGTESGVDQFVLSAGFHGVQPSTDSFKDEDKLKRSPDVPVVCSETVFSIDGTQRGNQVDVDAERNLWLMIKMPSATTTLNKQEMTITITAEKQ
ncbi:MAG: CARDB domain-containing protein [Bacteroidota bacterium]